MTRAAVCTGRRGANPWPGICGCAALLEYSRYSHRSARAKAEQLSLHVLQDRGEGLTLRSEPQVREGTSGPGQGEPPAVPMGSSSKAGLCCPQAGGAPGSQRAVLRIRLSLA